MFPCLRMNYEKISLPTLGDDMHLAGMFRELEHAGKR
jgi:hypothetical protein